MRPRWRAPGCSHTLGCRVRKARIVRFLFQIAVAQHAPGGRAIGIDMDSGETLCAEAGVRDQAAGSWKAVTIEGREVNEKQCGVPIAVQARFRRSTLEFRATASRCLNGTKSPKGLKSLVPGRADSLPSGNRIKLASPIPLRLR